MAPNPNARKAKLYNSRTIKTQLTDPSFVGKERLMVPDFLSAREFEIKSFELSQLNSKYASSNRVFQSLPRVLRRRAASHNVKRIPKRLRNRAIREMKNSINGLPPKKAHLRGRELYRLKMSKKLLKLGSRLKLLRNLPNNDFYDKKLNLRSRIKIINEQIKANQGETPKLNNVVGAYDSTGINCLAERPRGNIKYYKRQTNHVWLPTHVWHAKRFHMIKQHGYQIPLSPTQKCFKLMNRQSKHGSILFDTTFFNSMIMEINDEENFHEFLLELLRYQKKVPSSILNGEKSYNNWINIDGKKVGHGFVYANVRTRRILLRTFPSIYTEVFENLRLKVTNIYDCRYSLGSLDVTGPLALNSLSKVLHLDGVDSKIKDTWFKASRINDSKTIPVGTTFSFNINDPRLWKRPSNPPPSEMNANDLIIKLSQGGLVCQASLDKLFDNKKRNESYRGQLSIKALSARFHDLDPTSNELSVPSSIPLLISKISESSWTMILPWFWVLPVWSKLIAVRNLNVGGLKQVHQYNYEINIPTFPQDYPWLRDGWTYNEAMGLLTHEKYKKLPSQQVHGNRADYTNLDVVSPFKCDWTALRNIIQLKGLCDFNSLPQTEDFASFDELTRKINSIHDFEQVVKALNEYNGDIPIELHEKGTVQALSLDSIAKAKISVVQVSIELVKNGVIKDGARIYAPNDITPDENGDFNIPHIDIIGFVTSGTYNLNVGRATGIATVSSDILTRTSNYVLIRNIGHTKFYLANYSHIK